jgi:hypothetical protein
MIAKAKTAQALCGNERTDCQPAAHILPFKPCKLLLPAQRHLNEPFACRVLPIRQEEKAVQLFEGLPKLDSDDYATFHEMARAIADYELGAQKHNYPQRWQEFQYMTAVQWSERVVALVFIGPAKWVRREINEGREGFFETCFISSAATLDGRGGCILLHARWGREFIKSIQRDAERRVEKQLERRRTR